MRRHLHDRRIVSMSLEINRHGEAALGIFDWHNLSHYKRDAEKDLDSSEYVSVRF